MTWANERAKTPPYVLAFPTALVIVDPDDRYLEVRFFDGTKVPAQAEDTDDARERAADLGYAGEDPTWEMTRDHDLWHLWLSRPRTSPVLWGVAHPEERPDPDAARVEEAHALARAERHDKTQPRPWETSREVRRGTLRWGWPGTADDGESVRHQWVDVYHGPYGLGTEVPDHTRSVEGLR